MEEEANANARNQDVHGPCHHTGAFGQAYHETSTPMSISTDDSRCPFSTPTKTYGRKGQTGGDDDLLCHKIPTPVLPVSDEPRGYDSGREQGALSHTTERHTADQPGMEANEEPSE